jgi:predicted nucleic acid-binding protein
MDWVVDCSVAISWLMPDESSFQASGFFAQQAEDSTLFIPPLFWYEVANVLARARRRHRLPADKSDQIIAQLSCIGLKTTSVSAADAIAATSHALVHNLSAYDAAYLALAITRQCGLATLDQRLMTAARSHGIPLPW